MRQQELLSREVHHRVKNSLQMAVSFLNRCARQLAEPSAQDALVETSRQVSAIADVHELIQVSATLDRIDVSALLRQLCSHLERGPEPQVAFQAGKPLLIDAAQAANIPVITNELITNALKHARTQVEVICATEQDEFVLEVRDDGPGVPAGFDLGRNARFGLRMAASIAAQLGGSLVAQSAGKGAAFRLRVPLARLTVDAPKAVAGSTVPLWKALTKRTG